LLAAVVLLVMTSAAAADSPKAVIVGPETVPAGSVLYLDASASVSEKPIVWQVKRGGALALIPLDSGGRSGIYAIAPNPPPGRYLITAKARGTTVRPDDVSEAEADADIDVIEVEVLAPAPAPRPNPGPDPQPPPPTPGPPPVAGKLWVIYVVDAANPTPADAAVRTDPTLRSTLPGMDASWRTYQSGEEDLARLNYQQHVAKLGLPCAFVVDAKGNYVSGAKAPKASEVLALVKQARGVR
jgi:hypothetical protein